MPPAKSPLSRHATGQWYRRHKGRNYYFGTDQTAALRRYLDEWPAILAGRPPGRTPDPDALTLADAANKFLHRKRQAVDSGELTAEVWQLYQRVAARILAALGRARSVASLTPADFGHLRAKLAEGRAPTTLMTDLRLARALFAYAYESIDRPPKYGDQFYLPSAKTVRLHREAQPRKLLPADVLRRLIEAADPTLRAQILLGLNCGFGATDLSELRTRHLDRPGWVILPRRKTGVSRRAPLWPETVAALDAARPLRPAPVDPADADRVFLSHKGLPVRRYRERTAQAAGTRGDAVGAAWSKLCKREGVKGPGSFYLLRHIFRTVADELPDRPAVDLIMGHGAADMRSHYVERVDDRRLVAVVEHVRKWLGLGISK